MEAKEYSDKGYLGKVGDNLQNRKQESVKPIKEQVEKHQKVAENPNASSLQKATSLGLSVVEGAKGAYDALSGIGKGVIFQMCC